MHSNLPDNWHIQLPAWVADVVAQSGTDYGTDEAQMRLAVALSNGNIDAGDGGPFGAAVFDQHDRLVAAAPNLVFASGASLAHAEMVALTLAQSVLGSPDLSAYELTLVTNAEPCAMCLGALPWSGIRRLVCGARDADIRAVGFDEGSKPPLWEAALADRGIRVTRDVLRQEAANVLARYVQQAGKIY